MSHSVHLLLLFALTAYFFSLRAYSSEYIYIQFGQAYMDLIVHYIWQRVFYLFNATFCTALFFTFHYLLYIYFCTLMNCKSNYNKFVSINFNQILYTWVSTTFPAQILPLTLLTSKPLSMWTPLACVWLRTAANYVVSTWKRHVNCSTTISSLLFNRQYIVHLVSREATVTREATMHYVKCIDGTGVRVHGQAL